MNTLTEEEKEELRNLIKVIEAFLCGKEVQYYQPTNREWRSISSPTFDCTYKWRIKPKPRKLYVAYDRDNIPKYMSEYEANVEFWLRGSLPGVFTIVELVEVV